MQCCVFVVDPAGPWPHAARRCGSSSRTLRPMAVEAALAAMERNGADERQILQGCLVGHAVLELVKLRPAKCQAVH
jgi:hypothetical protein